ncbi:Putative hydrolase [Mycobacteroides abscessus subsp. abscessus]|nr:Putative hydrolase [Mycobacteroides abscessus subsp. abscessus]
MTHPALIASDVDGTLIDSAEILSARTRAVITAAVESGSTFVLATGRPPRWVTPIVDALGFAPISVCANGSVLYDAENDRIISAATLSPSELAVLAEVAQAAIPGAAITYSTDNGLIEVMPTGISKASGIAIVAKQAGVQPESIIAFGDMPNDVAMLRWAGHGVAMGNAHPEARAAANEVTATNNDDGVAKVPNAGGAEVLPAG